MSQPLALKSPRQAVFLDRDGVLNRAVVRDGRPFPPSSIETFEILPDVHDALARLHEAGFLLIGATNQPDVARGGQRREVVEAMHDQLLYELPITAIFVCYEDGDDCPRKKPNPGLLIEAANAYGIDLAASFMVGDRWRDVEAGRRAGCKTIFIDLGYSERRPDPDPDHVALDLESAASWILCQPMIGA